ncbi:MAG: signal peptidase I [Elusimicrobia bacterium]|jgi:signal peptidase I|nr:signal peptidase I [Elusimicrobiota bacterium]
MARVFFLVALGLGGAFFLRTFAFERIEIVSGSMEPALPVGARVMVNKLAYVFHPPERGDIVTFLSPKGEKGLVKRVVAVGGDNVRVVKKKVVLNGKPLEEPYVKHTRPNELLKGDDFNMGKVPSGFVVVMGDNRDESGDSRDWKGTVTGLPTPFVSQKAIEGKLMVNP